MSNNEWINLLVQEFDVSRTTAKNMLHGLMKMKKYDNVRKLFNGNDYVEDRRHHSPVPDNY